MELFRKRFYVSFLLLLRLGQHVSAQSAVTEKKDLDFFIARATKASPLIKDYQNQLMINKIDSMRLKAGYGPQVSASSAGLYAPRINGYGFDEVMTNGQSLDALLNVNYTLAGGSLKANQIQSLKLQRDSINYAIGISLLDLQKAIAEQYILAYDSQQQVTFNQDMVRLLQKEEVLLKTLTRSNVYKQSEYLTFLVAFRQQQLQLNQVQLKFQTEFANLKYLSGIKENTTFILIEPELKQDTFTQPGSSFFIRRFEIDSLRAINDKQAVDLNYRPKVNVYANGGYNSSLILQPYKNFGTSVGFSLLIPIYDGHQKKMQQQKIDLQSRTVNGYRNFFLGQQQQQLRMLHQQIDLTQQLFTQIDEQVRLSRGLIDVDSKLLHTGDVKVTDFVIAINNYMVAQNAMRQANINRLKLINQLNYWNR